MKPVVLELPATSANLGPGFDALALALDPTLRIEASAAERMSIHATGRSPDICSAMSGNLMLDTYETIWRRMRKDDPAPLALIVDNGIPLGMGCGSSAASRTAGVALAALFGELGWDRTRILNEVAALEHHPDNAAACCLGGFTATGMAPGTGDGPDRVLAVRMAPPAPWRALLVLPARPLATTASRGVLPKTYPRSEIVPNLQNVALLTAAFATGDGELLRHATGDRMHQPFRAEVCPLLPVLLPLAGNHGILSVTLSGAGSGVLLLLADEAAAAEAERAVRDAAAALPVAETVHTGLRRRPALLGSID